VSRPRRKRRGTVGVFAFAAFILAAFAALAFAAGYIVGKILL
jgi:hypothetical protein